MVKVPIAAGEEWGNRWDFNRLVENHDIDYVRATLPNVGGITEMMKIAALCETHFVGIVPHFTGPIATAALVNCLSTFSGPVLMEYNFGGRTLPHLPVCLDFKEGKLYPNERPGLGVELDMKQLTQIAGGDEVRYEPGADLFPSRWLNHELVNQAVRRSERAREAERSKLLRQTANGLNLPGTRLPP